MKIAFYLRNLIIQTMIDSLDKMVMKCGQCSSSEFIEVKYGNATKEMVNSTQKDNFRLGGCVVHSESPTHECKICGTVLLTIYEAEELEKLKKDLLNFNSSPDNLDSFLYDLISDTTKSIIFRKFAIMLLNDKKKLLILRLRGDQRLQPAIRQQLEKVLKK